MIEYWVFVMNNKHIVQECDATMFNRSGIAWLIKMITAFCSLLSPILEFKIPGYAWYKFEQGDLFSNCF